jgi:hypothetical protein
MADAARTPERVFTLSEFASGARTVAVWCGRRSHEEGRRRRGLERVFTLSEFASGARTVAVWCGRQSHEEGRLCRGLSVFLRSANLPAVLVPQPLGVAVVRMR